MALNPGCTSGTYVWTPEMMLVAVWCLGRPLFHFIGPFSCVIPGSHSTISVSVSLLAKWDLNYTIKLQKLKKPVNSGYIWNKVWDWASGIGCQIGRLTLFCCFILCLFYLIFKIYLFIFWLCLVACGISILWPGIEPVPPTVAAWSLTVTVHWTVREAALFFRFHI